MLYARCIIFRNPRARKMRSRAKTTTTTTTTLNKRQTTMASNKTVRMSADEKRRAILGVYHRTKEVYTEKEIIALATKAGVNQNT
jgi:pyruvate/2-oxoglutarate dehydrogenase complex dihydrolipoamide dehydrogenase (E3) component